MLHLYVPPSLRHFTPRRVVDSPATRYMALEYDLVEALRPRLIVDLGTGDGSSFFTYCQSMHDHDIDGICYGIDTWPETAPVTFDVINDHGRRFYPGIYYVIRMAAYEARRHFDDESIDLLRIDGTRPDVIGGADVEAWCRRVRSGGIIAWHGATADPKLWTLIAFRCPTVSFRDGNGLGLALKPGVEPRSELIRLLFRENQLAELERFYGHVHEHHERLRTLASLRGESESAS